MHADKQMPVRKYTVSEARANFKDVVDEVVYTRHPAIVTKSGKESVAVVPYDLLDIFLRIESLLDLDKANSALKDYKLRGGVTLEQLKKELGLDDD